MDLAQNIKHRHEFAKKHLGRVLFYRLWMFVIIYLVLLGFIIIDVAQHSFNPFYIFVAFLLGLGVGYLVSKIFQFTWHKESSKVVARIDSIGIFIIALYTLFTIYREWIFSFWVHGPLLTAFTFTFATGAILGRLLVLNMGIRRVLADRGIVTPEF